MSVNRPQLIIRRPSGGVGGGAPFLSDGPHIYLSCSNCRARLVDLWITVPEANITWQVRAANCPFCDEDERSRPLGGSYPTQVRGIFTPGGYGERKSDDPSDEVVSTVIDGQTEEEDVVAFVVGKYSKDSKPVRER